MTPPATPANEADIAVVDELLHGKEDVVHADASYSGAGKQGCRKKPLAMTGGARQQFANGA